jgi:uncharacterized protein
MLLSTLLLMSWGSALAAPPPEWEPLLWPPPPGLEGRAAWTGPPREAPRGGLVEGAYRWYRRVSVSDGPTCSYYPTCSAYAILAVRERGIAVGSLLALDRLLREYPWMDRVDHYPIVMPHNTPRLADPVPPRNTRERR